MIYYYLAMLAAGLTADCYLKRRFHQESFPHTFLLSLLSCILLTTAFHDPVRIMKGCIFSQLLVIISYIDWKSKEIPPALLIPVFLCGLPGLRPIPSLAGAAALPLIMIVTACISGNTGGGDIKLMSACGFVLGLYASLWAALIGFISFVMVLLILRKDRSIGYPLAPYLSAGCFTAYLFT